MDPISFDQIEISLDDGGWVVVKDFMSDCAIRIPDYEFRKFWDRLGAGLTKKFKSETWIDHENGRILLGEARLLLGQDKSGKYYYTIEYSFEVRALLGVDKEIRDFVDSLRPGPGVDGDFDIPKFGG